MSSQHATDQFYCAEQSLAKGEQLYATATRADNWLLLSYDGVFTRKPLDDARIPDAVKSHLQAAARSTPHTRVQLIKKQHRAHAPLMCYIARAALPLPVLYRFPLTVYEDLLTLDIADLLAGSDQYAAHVTDEPIYLICTHGMHDLCCSRWGTPVFTHLAARTDCDVWQTNHIGGHRFAANMLCLPSGVMYGRLSPFSADVIIDATHSYQLLSEFYRGNVTLDAPSQAAEYYLRRESGITTSQRQVLSGVERVSDTIFRAAFAIQGRIHRVTVECVPNSFSSLTSCTASEQTEIAQYQLIGYTQSG